ARPEVPAARDRSRTPPDSATECARRLPLAHLAALPSPFSTAAQNDSPAPARSGLLLLPSRAAGHPQTAGSLADIAANPPAGKLAVYAQYGKAATIPHSRSLRSSLSLLQMSATLFAMCNSANPAVPVTGRKNQHFPGPRFRIHVLPRCRRLPPALVPKRAPARSLAPILRH